MKGQDAVFLVRPR
jgi:hypothetical protein